MDCSASRATRRPASSWSRDPPGSARVACSPSSASRRRATAAGFEEVGNGDGGEGDASFAALHGLYWLTLNLAGERPLLLAVDNLQWGDRPSLRFLAYLTRRLEGVGALLAVG